MTKKYVNSGSVFQHTAVTEISSGDVVVMGNVIGVALVDIAVGETGSVQVEGVFNLPKVSGAVIAQGESVIYDVSASEFDDNQATPAAGDISNSCLAVEGAGNGETTVKVKLNTGIGAIT